MLWIGIVLSALVVWLAYVRLAPSDPERWHVPIVAQANADMAGGAVRIISGDAARLVRLDAAMLALERTVRLAGTPEEGRVTYLTRSRVFGFPDYTTVELADDGTLRLYARLRFGGSDLGVNASRLRQVIAASE